MTPRNYGMALTLAGALAAGAFAQNPPGGAPPSNPTGPGTGTPPPGTGPTTPGRGPTTPTPTQPTQPQQPTTPPQPIFVSGRVMLEDGTPPPEPVVIERVCNGSPRSEGHTDSKGYFGFELGNKFSGALRDASEGSGFDFGNDPFASNTSSRGGNSPQFSSGSFGFDNRLVNCELRARLAGYRSQVVSLANRRPLRNPDVGIILLHRLSPNEGPATVSAVSLAAPKDAKKAYDKGRDALKKKKLDEAQKSFEKAVEVYPKYAVAWFELARLRAAQGQAEPSRQALDEAIKADPKFVPPYLEVAMLEIRAQRWKELAEVTDTIIKLDSFDYPQAYLFNAVAKFNLQDIEGAEKSALQAERLDTRHVFPKSSHLLGIIKAQRQDYTGAAEKFKIYLKFAPNAPDAVTVRGQLEQIEKQSAQSKPDQQ